MTSANETLASWPPGTVPGSGTAAAGGRIIVTLCRPMPHDSIGKALRRAFQPECGGLPKDMEQILKRLNRD